MNDANGHEASHIAGIVLAAGSSARFGKTKQLIHWRGMPLIRHVVIKAIEADLSPIIVVVGSQKDEVTAIIIDLPVEIVHNPEWEFGQSTSLVAGLNALNGRQKGCIFLLADQPQVTVPVLRSLVEAHALTSAPIIAPLVLGQRSNPVLFDQVTFADLMEIKGDQGGRAIFSKYPIQWLEWLDQALLIDIDTPEDLIKLDSL